MARRFSPRGIRAILWTCAGCWFLLAMACSGSGYSSATGKVMFQGKPVKGAVVIFHPKDGKFDAQRPSAVTDENGNYSLSTGPKTGAPPGEYQVSISWPEEPQKKGKAGKIMNSSDDYEDTKDRLGGRFLDATRSNLTATIKSGANTIPTFDLN